MLIELWLSSFSYFTWVDLNKVPTWCTQDRVSPFPKNSEKLWSGGCVKTNQKVQGRFPKSPIATVKVTQLSGTAVLGNSLILNISSTHVFTTRKTLSHSRLIKSIGRLVWSFPNNPYLRVPRTNVLEIPDATRWVWSKSTSQVLRTVVLSTNFSRAMTNDNEARPKAQVGAPASVSLRRECPTTGYRRRSPRQTFSPNRYSR